MNTLLKAQFASPKQYNNFFGKNIFNELYAPVATGSIPAVNIAQSPEGFKIEVAVPGFTKSDFKLNTERNQLTISADKSQGEIETGESYTRREFNYVSFQRTFTLPDSIDGDKIEAHYENGILSVLLPKREDAKEKAARQIEIA